MVTPSEWLRPGINTSPWSYMKFLRAVGLHHELRTRYELDATASADRVVAEVSEDRHKAVFKLATASSHPVGEFALIFGDLVHNHRSALDSLAWELTHMDGAKPSESQERNIYFPMCTSEKAWDKQVKGPLSTVPPRFLAALYDLQPLHHPVPGDSVVIALHELDITDKHKASIHANAHTHNRGTLHMEIKDEHGKSLIPEKISFAGPRLYVDGQPLFDVTTKEPIATATSAMNVPTLLMITRNDGRTMELWNFLGAIHNYMEAVFDAVYKGIEVDPRKVGFSRTKPPMTT